MTSLLVLSAADVYALVDRVALLAALADGFRALDRGDVQAPPRVQVATPRGFSLSMPAWRPGGPIAVKQVSVFDGNAVRGLPTHSALVTLLDEHTGMPLALIDGASVTALRTAGAAMLAAQLGARPDARSALVVGGGVQASEHAAFVRAALPGIERLATWSRRDASARGLEAAVRAVDIVFLCTSSATAVVDATWITPGTHVSSIGYAPPAGELPDELARTGRLLVETMAAFEPPPVGCGELTGVDAAEAITLGAAVDGVRVRRDESEITVYKAMGNAMEDLVCATLAYRAAQAAGVGQTVEL